MLNKYASPARTDLASAAPDPPSQPPALLSPWDRADEHRRRAQTFYVSLHISAGTQTRSVPSLNLAGDSPGTSHARSLGCNL